MDPNIKDKNFIENRSSENVIEIKRNAFDWKQFSDKYGKNPPKEFPCLENLGICAKNRWNRFSFISCLMSLFPIIRWLPKYDVKKYLLSDIMAGLTISVLHVPQGIANAFILDLDPVNGLYVSFFPALIYTFMGTSRHLSIGSFVVASLIMSNTTYRLGAVPTRDLNTTTNGTVYLPPTTLEVLTTVGIVTGIMQIIMGFLSLGSLSLILSDELISSFTTGSAVHVLISQLDTILGMNVSNQSGAFKLIKVLDKIRKEIHNSNVWTVSFSLIIILVLITYKEFLDPIVKKSISVPIPIDLLVVIVSTLISWLIEFETLNIEVVGKLTTGIPVPSVPRFDFVSKVLLDCFIIATVTFAISLSLAKIFAKRNKYEVYPNQEFIALGSANIFSSFFSTFPASAALSRSTLQERLGGKTQIASLFSCLVILSVMLVLAPYLYHLPQFVLSSILIVAIKSLFKQFKDFWEFWFASKLEGTVWLVTFLSIVILDVDIGLIIGIIVSLHVILIRIIMPTSSLLGYLPSTEMYVDIKKYSKAEEIKGVKILRFCSPIFYLSIDVFKNKVYELALIEISDRESIIDIKRPKIVILDMSCVPFMDKSGVETIIEVIQKLKQKNIILYLVSCPIQVIEMFEKTKFFHKFEKCCVYPTIHDAVICSK